jgi:hypothetical protein
MAARSLSKSSTFSSSLEAVQMEHHEHQRPRALLQTFFIIKAQRKQLLKTPCLSIPSAYVAISQEEGASAH